MTKIFSEYIPDVGSVLKNLLSTFGNLSGSELAKRSGVPVSTINRILAGTVVDPKVSTLKPLANFFGISVDQLLGFSPLPERFDRYSQPLRLTIALPVFKLEQITLVEKNTNRWFNMVLDDQYCSDTFALSVDSYEFEPIFSKDSILIIKPSMLPAQNNDFVTLIFDQDPFISIRRFKIEGGEHYFVPLNPQLKAIYCSEKKHKLLGVVSEAHTKLREI